MKCILVVDDDTDYLRLFNNFLLQEGFSVKCAISGDNALSILKDSTIHLMITDLNMPNMNGIELAKRASTIMPQLPIILITGTIADVTQTAEDAGIKKILYKPSDPQEILVTVMNILKI